MAPSSSHRFPPTEGGVFAWFAVVGCALWLTVFSSVEKCFGVYLVHFQRTYPTASVDQLAAIGVLVHFFNSGAAPLVAVAVNRGATPRRLIFVSSVFLVGGALASSFASSVTQLYLTYGVCMGVASGFVYNASYLAVLQYFQRRLALVFGIVYFGLALGGIVLPPLVELLVQEFGFRGMMIVVAGILLESFVIGALTRPIADSYPAKKTIPESYPDSYAVETASERKNRISLNTEEQKETMLKEKEEGCSGDSSSTSSTESRISLCSPSSICHRPDCNDLGFNLSLLRDPVFVLFLFSQMASVACINWSPIYLPALAVERGVSGMKAALLLSYEHFTMIVVTPIFGLLLNHPTIQRHWRHVGVVCLTLAGGADFLLPFLTSYAFYSAYAVFHGAMYGLSLVLRAPLMTDLMGRRHLESLVGFLNLSVAVGFAIPLIAGALVDRFRTQDAAYFVHAASNAAAAAALAAAACLRRRTPLKDEE